MQISNSSDYALRILMYLAVSQDRLVTSREIADAYDLSFDHIAKVAQLLARDGYVDAVRGRGGGMRLAKEPDQIPLGSVLRSTEAGLGLVECKRPGSTHCILTSMCTLSPILSRAHEVFLDELDKHTLADALPRSKVFKKAVGLER